MTDLYNRYIPQSDGSYQRRSMPERSGRPVPTPAEPPQPQPPPEPAPVCGNCPHRPKRPSEPRKHSEGMGFFRSLLPLNLDAEDLLIVVLLLLMSGEGQHDRNLPLLTLALYLFL